MLQHLLADGKQGAVPTEEVCRQICGRGVGSFQQVNTCNSSTGGARSGQRES